MAVRDQRDAKYMLKQFNSASENEDVYMYISTV